MINHENAQQLTQFREQVYQNFNKRADTLMDLLDAISSNTQARSVVELSLQDCFRRDYSSLFKAVAGYEPEKASKSLAQQAAPYLPELEKRKFWLFGVDVTPQSRPYAPSLADRSYVYQPTPMRSNKPITIGHQYSDVFYLPEREPGRPKHWVVPLSTQRVKTTADKELTGAEQIEVLLEDEEMPFYQQLCAEVVDSSYSKPAYLHANRSKENLVSIARSRGNRTYYRQPLRTDQPTAQGHPTWFGQAFHLLDPSTWPTADETAQTTFTSCKGRIYTVRIDAWYDLRMHGERKPASIPMHLHPFTLLRIRLFNANGELAYKNPMWLIVIGEKRRHLTLIEIFEAYQQRFDLEHFFRFGKQRMLLDAFQTPETTYEEHWWHLVHLAYLQLWIARDVATSLPRPWERALPAMKAQAPTSSPALVQRDFGRIIRQFGTPAQVPKRRGKSPGRPQGTVLTPRQRPPVVFKGKT